MHYEARAIIRQQVTYYTLQHWMAKTDEDKDKYADLVIVWANKLELDK
jgi:hypothetical protein|tara:strand:+ start:1220 stop:1363 length:144 start_codon:yes stop_codon:yes gene_type:complete